MEAIIFLISKNKEDQKKKKRRKTKDNISIHKADETEPVHLIPYISRGKKIQNIQQKKPRVDKCVKICKIFSNNAYGDYKLEKSVTNTELCLVKKTNLAFCFCHFTQII